MQNLNAQKYVPFNDWNREKRHLDLKSNTNEPVFTKVQCKIHFWAAYHGRK